MFSGNLGIGVTYVTGVKLAVDGQVRFKSFTVAAIGERQRGGGGIADLRLQQKAARSWRSRMEKLAGVYGPDGGELRGGCSGATT